MSSLAIIGLQWGDEGKGKITDLLGEKGDFVVRYQGGNNAGHTIYVKDEKTTLHLLPSGILHPHCISVIGHGVSFDPQAFLDELAEIKNKGVKVTPEQLKVSENCHVITSYHRLLDTKREEGASKIGTTHKGVGPCYEDKVARRGIRTKDLLDKDILLEKISHNIKEKKILFKYLYQVDFPSAKEEADRLYTLGKSIRPFLCNTFSVLEQGFRQNKKVLYEGAQGILLDMDYGTYPYVTSSHTFYGGIYTGAGMPKHRIKDILGVAKAYTTRVGEGPFPTELSCDWGRQLQSIGKEFGSTTGRQRRCGHLDLPLLKYTVKVSNITSFALTKLDVLSQMEKLRCCIAYEYEGKKIDCPLPGMDLSKVKPVYRDFPPFSDDFKSKNSSPELKNYLKTIEDFLGIPIGIMAYGPNRNQVRCLRNYF